MYADEDMSEGHTDWQTESSSEASSEEASCAMQRVPSAMSVPTNEDEEGLMKSKALYEHDLSANPCDDILAAAACQQIGHAYQKTGMFKKACIWLTRALDFLNGTGDDGGAAMLHASLGQVTFTRRHWRFLRRPLLSPNEVQTCLHKLRPTLQLAWSTMVVRTMRRPKRATSKPFGSLAKQQEGQGCKLNWP